MLLPQRSTALIVATSISLTACTTPAPMVAPSGRDIWNYARENYSEYWGTTPRDTLIIGVSYVDEKCSAFFDSIERAKQELTVTQSTLVTAGNQTQIILATAKAAALSIAIVAGVAETTKVLLSEYLQEFVFAPHSSELKSIVEQAMQAQKKEFGELVSDGRLTSQVEAIAAVKQYAQNCTLATIKEHWNNSIAKAVREGVTADIPADEQRSFVAPAGQGRSLQKTPRPPTNVLGVHKYGIR
ncbi:hypothetical protein [Rhizobium sophoriradicis]|uniref:Lipoprotein n=1 Tax=Rhizobium sophoriradicis TaxID=1535245 RepID=A0A2A5KN60_9HYPH|nr:hypothetical protein [Rhizobium sophoriradicis]PCK78468.1 hypothetical protein CPT34_24655 [Rhizobium sophoriradicis]